MLTAGDLLKKARLKKNLTLEDVEKATRIRKKSLMAVEKGNWLAFDSKTYSIGIIKTYGKFLNLEEERLLAFFRREYERKDDSRFKERVQEQALTPTKKRNFKLFIIALAILFLFYFGYQVKLYITPPHVDILSPKTDTFKIENQIKLVGKTEKDTTIIINGNKIYPDSNNIFTYLVPLTKNKNLVTILVTGANGKTTIIKKVYIKTTDHQE